METSSKRSTSSNRPGSRASRSKSSGAEPARGRAWAVSVALHGSFVAAFLILRALGGGPTEKIEIVVIENPKPAPPQLDLSRQKPPEPAREEPPVARKVFGVSKKALTSDETGPGVAVKAGNTVATAPDDLQLKDSDEALPIPTDEYLVSKMPAIQSEFRIPYPAGAKEKRIEGRVVLDLLIDAEGRVRDARLVSGPGAGLNEAALEAIRQFRFRPAEVEGKAVAVRTRFTYNFELER